MAPSYSRQLLAWTFPTIAVLLSYLWFKRRRIGARSDPGGTSISDFSTNKDDTPTVDKKQQGEEKSKPKSPEKCFSRSLSGVDSAPIDIVFPPQLRSTKSNPVVISDEDLDLEIEKIKSMKNDSFSKVKPYLKSPEKTAPQEEQKIEATQPPITEEPTTEPTTTIPVLQEENKENVIENPQIDTVTTPKKAMNIKCEAAKETQADQQEQQEQTLQPLQREETDKMPAVNGQVKAGKGKKGKKGRMKGVPLDLKPQPKRAGEPEELQRQSSERDSANHSPADFMLASLSLSSISDNHSEGSNDSGKGGSDVATPPSRTPAGDGSVSGDLTLPTVYEFVIPQTLVGRLIGRHGAFVTEINVKTRATIYIKKHPTSSKLKVCAVEGTQLEIDNALQMIRNKFPLKRYPEVTLEQVSFLPLNTVPLSPEHLHLKLIEGINNDTIVSCMVTPGHLFLQQPTHPTYPNLNLLTEYMYRCYSELDSPQLPRPVPENTVCVAHSVGVWYRAMILSTDKDTDMSYVKFLDYGGYAYIENSKLRQIRGDFLLLPFQAAECILANIRPIGGEEAAWVEEAYNYVAESTKGAIVYTQIVNYTEDGLPLVVCYVVIGGPQQYVCLNQELVNRGYAEWLTYEDQPQQHVEEAAEGAVGGDVRLVEA